MAGRGTQTTGTEPSSRADFLATLDSIIRASGSRGILLADLLCEYERLTGVPQANVKRDFTPETFVVFLETELGIVYEPTGADQFLLKLTRAHQSAAPSVHQQTASQPCAGAPIPRFRPQDGLSEVKYSAVYISQAYGIDEFYVQLRGRETSLRLEQLMNDLECVYEGGLSKAFALSDVWEGMPCAAPYVYKEGGSDWHRAVITSVSCEPHLCHVFYVDYGTQGTVARSSIRALKSEFFDLPTQAIRASLACLKPVAPSGWTAQSKAFFMDLVDGDKIYMCKLVGPHQADKFNVAICDTSRKPEVFLQDLVVKAGHAQPLYTEESNFAALKIPPQLALPVQNGSGAGGEAPTNVRPTFGRGRAPPLARVAALVDCTVKTGAFPPRTTSAMVMRPAHFRSSDQDSNVRQQANSSALVSSAGPNEKRLTVISPPPPATRPAQSEASSSGPAVRAEREELERRMTALPFGRSVAPEETASAVPAAGWSAVPSASLQRPGQPATHPTARFNGPFHQQRALGGAAVVGWAQFGFQPLSPVHHLPVPAARTPPHSCPAVPLGVTPPVAAYPAAPQSSGPGSATTTHVSSIGGAAGPAVVQQQEDVMCALQEALDDEPCLARPVMVAHLSTGHRLRMLNHDEVLYISADEVCELLYWPHGQLQRELVARDSDFPRLLTLKREEHGQLFERMAPFDVPGLHAYTPELDFVRLEDVPVVLNVFGSGVALRPVKEEVSRVLASFDPRAPYWSRPAEGEADVQEQLVNLRARRKQLQMEIYQGCFVDGLVDELTRVEQTIAALERRVGTTDKN